MNLKVAALFNNGVELFGIHFNKIYASILTQSSCFCNSVYFQIYHHSIVFPLHLND